MRVGQSVKLVKRLQHPHAPISGTIRRLTKNKVLVLFPISKMVWLNREDVTAE